MPGANYINDPIPCEILHVVRSLEFEICQLQEVSSCLWSVLLLQVKRVWCINLVLNVVSTITRINEVEVCRMWCVFACTYYCATGDVVKFFLLHEVHATCSDLTFTALTVYVRMRRPWTLPLHDPWSRCGPRDILAAPLSKLTGCPNELDSWPTCTNSNKGAVQLVTVRREEAKHHQQASRAREMDRGNQGVNADWATSFWYDMTFRLYHLSLLDYNECVTPLQTAGKLKMPNKGQFL